MIKKILKKVQGFTPVELALVVGLGALVAGALVFLATSPQYMAQTTTKPVNVNIKVDSASRTPSAMADDDDGLHRLTMFIDGAKPPVTGTSPVPGHSDSMPGPGGDVYSATKDKKIGTIEIWLDWPTSGLEMLINLNLFEKFEDIINGVVHLPEGDIYFENTHMYDAKTSEPSSLDPTAPTIACVGEGTVTGGTGKYKKATGTVWIRCKEDLAHIPTEPFLQQAGLVPGTPIYEYLLNLLGDMMLTPVQWNKCLAMADIQLAKD